MGIELRGVTGAGPRAVDERAARLSGLRMDGSAIRGRRWSEPSGYGTDTRLQKPNRWGWYLDGDWEVV